MGNCSLSALGRLASAGGTESIAGEGWTQPAGSTQPETLTRAHGIMAGVLGLPSPCVCKETCGCLAQIPNKPGHWQSARDLGLGQREGRV